MLELWDLKATEALCCLLTAQPSLHHTKQCDVHRSYSEATRGTAGALGLFLQAAVLESAHLKNQPLHGKWDLWTVNVLRHCRVCSSAMCTK